LVVLRCLSGVGDRGSRWRTDANTNAT
jgi:hypothetical protein